MKQKTLKPFFLSVLAAAMLVQPALCAREISVKTVPLVLNEFAETLNIQGSVKAINTAKVSARIPGPIENIFVREGDWVKADETKLFQVDSVKLQTNVQIRKQEQSVALYSLKEKEARLKQAMADFEKAKADVSRFRLLWEDNSTSKDTFEKIELKEKISASNVELLKAVVALAKEQLKQTELALKIAEKDLSDSTVLAPINGVVAEKNQEIGETAVPGKPIIVISDVTHNEVAAYVPAEYYYRINQGQTKVIVKTNKDHAEEMTVSYKSPVINPIMRTFEIKCQTTKKGKNSFIPGQLAEMSVILSKKKGFAVPGISVVKRSNSSVIFAAVNKTAKMIKVKTGLENGEMTEISSDELKEGMKIITHGQYLLNDNQPIITSDAN